MALFTWLRQGKAAFQLVALPAVLGLILVACGNASGRGGGGSQTQGVTSNEIDIGGIAAKTGPLANQYGPIFQGVQAYLNTYAPNGVNGRKIKYVAQLDDQTLPSLNVSQARALVTQDKVFAVVGVATPIFAAGKYLADNNVPTFGWNVNPEWSDGASLFGEKGSYLNFTHPGPGAAWFANKLGAQKVGVIAYSVSQSAQCAQGAINTWQQFAPQTGQQVVLKDTSLPFGFTDISGDITQLKNSGAQFVGTCMDPTGNTVLSKGLQEAGLYNQVKQYWPNGYDQNVLSQYAPLMEGVYFSTGFVPYTYGFTQGMDVYLDAMKKMGAPVSDVTLAGWINADLFVTALKQVGNNVTRQNVINAINKMTHYTAGGISPGIDWTQQHKNSGPYNCTAFLQVQHGQFASVFGSGKNPFVCFQSPNATTFNPVPFPDDPNTFFNSTHLAPNTDSTTTTTTAPTTTAPRATTAPPRTTTLPPRTTTTYYAPGTGPGYTCPPLAYGGCTGHESPTSIP
jgi:branched-chain amino acid transport system substrate-binding protein